jgi:putative ubiquitin-RnfH superfamily antitoxin RatB of RatAB toxin-antitoxin module
MASADGARLHVTLARSTRADEVELLDVELPPGATVADALAAAGWVADPARWSVGIWGRVQPLGQPLADGDRIELCRALAVDPKEARRLRVRRQRKAKPAAR